MTEKTFFKPLSADSSFAQRPQYVQWHDVLAARLPRSNYVPDALSDLGYGSSGLLSL